MQLTRYINYILTYCVSVSVCSLALSLVKSDNLTAFLDMRATLILIAIHLLSSSALYRGSCIFCGKRHIWWPGSKCCWPAEYCVGISVTCCRVAGCLPNMPSYSSISVSFPCRFLSWKLNAVAKPTFLWTLSVFKD